MIFVWLTHDDGQWSTRQLSEADALDAKAKGCTVVTVEDRTWAAWQAHIDQHAAFSTMWCLLDNEAVRERNEAVREREEAMCTKSS